MVMITEDLGDSFIHVSSARYDRAYLRTGQGLPAAGHSRMSVSTPVLIQTRAPVIVAMCDEENMASW